MFCSPYTRTEQQTLCWGCPQTVQSSSPAHEYCSAAHCMMLAVIYLVLPQKCSVGITLRQKHRISQKETQEIEVAQMRAALLHWPLTSAPRHLPTNAGSVVTAAKFGVWRLCSLLSSTWGGIWNDYCLLCLLPISPAGIVRASSVFPILSTILLLLGGLCVGAGRIYNSKNNIILSAGILFVAAGMFSLNWALKKRCLFGLKYA